MVAPFLAELDALAPQVQTLLRKHHFDRDRFQELAARIGGPPDQNFVAGRIEAPAPGDVHELPPLDSAEGQRLYSLGADELRSGRSALVVLAGGMATRMGGVVKALVPALGDRTFLDLRLREMDAMQRQFGQELPLWLMVSHATEGPINAALGSRRDGYGVATFRQRLSVRLTPDGHLFCDASGEPSLYAPGHGDLVDALKDSGLLARFIEAGGRTLTMANLDNLGAGLDPRILGFHISQKRPLTCEVVEKAEGDRGGIPVRLEGRPVVLEEFRIPKSFEPGQVRVFNTNTFHFEVDALTQRDFPFTYFVVQKSVEGRPAIQFERLIGELTSYLDTSFLKVPRTGKESRFLPVKDHAELEQRKIEIEAVARHRGMW